MTRRRWEMLWQELIPLSAFWSARFDDLLHGALVLIKWNTFRELIRA